MTDTCQPLPTRGCMAAHQFAAESPCAAHHVICTRFLYAVPRCLTAEEWPRWGYLTRVDGWIWYQEGR